MLTICDADIYAFLVDYPGMTIQPQRHNSALQLSGNFAFSGQPESEPMIIDSYQLEISVSASFPRSIPDIVEVKSKIQRNGNYHVNPDGTLCLGSPLRIMEKISKNPTLIGFAETCLVPFLYAISHKRQNGGEFPFSELAHGSQGVIDDYKDLFHLDERFQVIPTIFLLGLKRRIANKKQCPCGCGKRLGKCRFHLKLNAYRALAWRSWYSAHAKSLYA